MTTPPKPEASSDSEALAIVLMRATCGPGCRLSDIAPGALIWTLVNAAIAAGFGRVSEANGQRVAAKWETTCMERQRDLVIRERDALMEDLAAVRKHRDEVLDDADRWHARAEAAEAKLADADRRVAAAFDLQNRRVQMAKDHYLSERDEATKRAAALAEALREAHVAITTGKAAIGYDGEGSPRPDRALCEQFLMDSEKAEKARAALAAAAGERS